MHKLFSNPSLRKHLGDRLDRVRREIAQVSNVAKLDDAVQLSEWRDAVEERELKVDRSASTREVAEDANGAKVAKLAVPFEGPGTLFWLQAKTYRDDLVGDVDPPRSSLLSDTKPLCVRFEGPLQGEVTVEEINAWAKGKADSLDEHVAWTNQEIQAHNQSAPSAVQTMVDARKRELQQIADLNKGLSGGI